MTIEYVSGDLFVNRYNAQALAHGCNCKGAMGVGVAIAIQNAMNTNKPLAAEELYQMPEIKLLVRLCYKLQKLQKNEPFWLSENDGALIFGVTRPTIGKWLNMLEADGIIRKVKEYTASTARRYKFIVK